MANDGLHGLVVLDKPAGITSRDAVNRAQGWFPRGTRLGHTGTLDPLATGVLVLCVGNATRLAEYVQGMPKTYHAGIVLGGRSDTDDADGSVTPSDAAAVPPEQVRAALATFLGPIEQVPPAYSAAKVAGRRAYDLARRGNDVSLAPRIVTVHAIDMLRYEYPRLEVEVRCGKGTYIRALARDLGERLSCGGYIETLRRTRVGCFDVAEAHTLDAAPALLPLALAVSELPRLDLPADAVARLRQGQALPLGAHDPASAEVALFDEHGALVAIGTVDADHGCIRPSKVFKEGAQ